MILKSCTHVSKYRHEEGHEDEGVNADEELQLDPVWNEVGEWHKESEVDAPNTVAYNDEERLVLDAERLRLVHHVVENRALAKVR